MKVNQLGAISGLSRADLLAPFLELSSNRHQDSTEHVLTGSVASIPPIVIIHGMLNQLSVARGN